MPLVKPAKQAIGEMTAARRADKEFAISTTGGARPVSVRTLHTWAHDIVGDAINGFQLTRVRSGVETLLAAAGVPRDVRGHLQSHDLTGVQARHYDGHDYMREKRQALEIVVKVICEARPAASWTAWLRSDFEVEGSVSPPTLASPLVGVGEPASSSRVA